MHGIGIATSGRVHQQKTITTDYYIEAAKINLKAEENKISIKNAENKIDIKNTDANSVNIKRVDNHVDLKVSEIRVNLEVE